MPSYCQGESRGFESRLPLHFLGTKCPLALNQGAYFLASPTKSPPGYRVDTKLFLACYARYECPKKWVRENRALYEVREVILRLLRRRSLWIQLSERRS